MARIERGAPKPAQPEEPTRATHKGDKKALNDLSVSELDLLVGQMLGETQLLEQHPAVQALKPKFAKVKPRQTQKEPEVAPAEILHVLFHGIRRAKENIRNADPNSKTKLLGLMQEATHLLAALQHDMQNARNQTLFQGRAQDIQQLLATIETITHPTVFDALRRHNPDQPSPPSGPSIKA